METKKTDNELIAEFMGAVKGHPDSDVSDLWFFDNDKSEKYLKYDTSWDWLMPVVEKIESDAIHPMFNFSMHLGKMYADITCTLRPSGVEPPPDIVYSNIHCDSKIECVYRCVVDFIKWYNQQTVTP